MDPIATTAVQSHETAYNSRGEELTTEPVEMLIQTISRISRRSGLGEKGAYPTHEKGPDSGERLETHEEQTGGQQDEEAAGPIDYEDEFPEGGLRAWLVVLGAWLLLFPSFGFMVSIGTLQDYWSQHQLSSYSSRDVGWIASVFVYLCLALGIWIGPLFDRYGPKWIAMVGSCGYLIMVFLLAQCSKFWQLMLCCGILGGITGAMLTTTSLAAVAHWFKIRRGLTQGIAMMGSSGGGFVIPLILKSALPKYGYAWSVRIVGFIFCFCFITGNFLLKARIPPSADAKKKSIVSLSIFGDLGLSLFTISVFGFEVVLFGSLGILPTYATVGTDFGPDTGFYLIAILNGVSCLGRILPGYVADRIGRFNTLFIMSLFTMFFMLVLWLPFGTSSLPALYSFAALFGFGTGSWMALIPACIGQLCKAEEFGRYYGSIYFVASFAALICVPISGELVETVGPQPLVAFMCVVLGLSTVSFIFSRWAIIGRRWTIKVKV